MSLDCLNNIIALSETVCVCYDADKPADYNTTTSGYYLDKLEGLSLEMANCLDDCSDGNLWELMADARAIACHDFTSELFAFIESNSRVARKPFKGFVGEVKWNATLPKLGDFHGLRLSPCNEIRGGFIYISGITTFMDTAVGAIEVQIWNNVDDAPLHTFNVASLANKRSENDVTTEDIKLPLWHEKCIGEDLEYYIIYQPVGFLPLNNKIDCGCGGKNKRADGWELFVDISGAYGDDTTDLEGFGSDAYTSGLCLTVETGCDLDDLICDNISSVSAGAIHRVIGRAIQFRAGEVLVEKILQSTTVNRYTLLENERLWGKRNHFRAEYQSRLDWLSEEIDITGNDCLTCGADDVISKRTIMS